MKWGIADTSGRLIVPTIYDAMGAMSEGLINAYINKKGGYILPDGKVAHQFVYDAAYPFSNGVAKVGKIVHGKLKFGLIDKDGQQVVPMEYDAMQDGFSDGLKVVGKLDVKHGKWSYGFIDATGKVVIPLKFSMAGTFNEGLCAARTMSTSTMLPLSIPPATLSFRISKSQTCLVCRCSTMVLAYCVVRARLVP